MGDRTSKPLTKAGIIELLAHPEVDLVVAAFLDHPGDAGELRIVLAVPRAVAGARHLGPFHWSILLE